jgi:methionyl aminopeptidase
MVVLKTRSELKLMRRAGQIAAQALALGGAAVRPGVTTAQINRIIHDYIVSQGATPSFLGYGGFPAAACISLNDEVIHGIPSASRRVQEGDIVSIDVGAFYQGFHGDNAATYGAGHICAEARALINATRESLYQGIKQAVLEARLGDIGHAVQRYVEQRGYGVVRQYVGHGVGRELHEAPEVPNFGTAGHGLRLMSGMTIAIEPMINIGGPEVRVMPDGWTVKTRSGGLSAHFEHTIAITSQGPVILTEPLGGASF